MTQQVPPPRTELSEKGSLAHNGETGIVVSVVVSLAPSRLNVLLVSPAVA
jgi:hypothetical protein